MLNRTIKKYKILAIEKAIELNPLLPDEQIIKRANLIFHYLTTSEKNKKSGNRPDNCSNR